MKTTNEKDQEQQGVSRAVIVGRLKEWADANMKSADVGTADVAFNVLGLLQICGELADLIPEVSELRGKVKMLAAHNETYKRELARLRSGG